MFKLFNSLKARSPKDANNDLPISVDMFKEEHWRFLKSLDKSPINKKFTGMVVLEIGDVDKFIKNLLNMNLIKYANLRENVECFKVVELKELLKDNSLMVTGNKLQLVERVIDNLQETQIKNNKYYKESYVLTEYGSNVLNEYLEKLEQRTIQEFQYNLQLIRQKRLGEAYSRICKSRAKKSISTGIGINWNQEALKGIDAKSEKIYLEALSNTTNIDVTTCAIYSIISGLNCKKIVDMFSKIDCTIDKKIFLSQESYELFTISNKEEIESYKEDGIKKYKILSCRNTDCTYCKEMDGKCFDVYKAKTGVNLPPFHKGCRCTTVACLD